MSELIKVAQYIPAHPSPRDPTKTVPAKIKDGNGTDFMVPKQLVGFIETHQGQAVEIEYTSVTNGQYTNRTLTSAKLSQASAPPPSDSPKQGNGWRRDPSETNSIIRQSSLKSAVEFSAGRNGSVKEVLAVAETFAAWVQGNVRVGTARPDKAALAKSLAEMVEETLEEADNAPHPAEARR